MDDLRRRLEGLAPGHILDQGSIILRESDKPIRLLLEQKRLPREGMDEDAIRRLLTILSSMDSDKDPAAARIGEREARVSCGLVSELSFGFNHGIGRSGDILAPQPKAAGASSMYNLANRIALDCMRQFGTPATKSAVVLPLATGMSIGLALSVCRGDATRNEVVVARCDHASPMKAISTMGMKAVVVDGEVSGDAVRVPVDKVKKSITERTAAILSTTTFFPPREPDDIVALSEVAEGLSIPHIVNNAYGVQSRKIMDLAQRAMRGGRVDAFVQSTDKNFLTPVGGSIVASKDAGFVDMVGKAYAGRASAAPVLQFLASMLFLGVSGYERLRAEQSKNRGSLEQGLSRVADEVGERILRVQNPIAVGMTLRRANPKKVGRNLYSLRVTGPRVLAPRDFGVCCAEYPSPYLTMNAAIGCSQEDIELALKRLRKALG